MHLAPLISRLIPESWQRRVQHHRPDLTQSEGRTPAEWEQTAPEKDVADLSR